MKCKKFNYDLNEKRNKQGSGELENEKYRQYKREKLFDGITDINDELVDQAGKLDKPFWQKRSFAAAAAILAVIAAGAMILRPSKDQTAAAGVIAQAEYPETAPYPDETDFIKEDGGFDDSEFSKVYDAWWEDVMARRSLTGYEDGLDDFFIKSTRQFLSAEKGENRVYSPLNVYMALGMLAELTDNNSRRQILDLLGNRDMETLRKQASDLWKANYCDDGALTSILSNSIWLNQDINFNKTTMESLAENYYASSYQGEMGSQELDTLFQNWLNEQTGGMLKEQVSGQKLSADMVLALASSIYYRAKWSYDFPKEKTKTKTFHTNSGDIRCEFMHKEQCAGTYYWGEKFSAAAQNLNESGCMWFLLPDEGTSIEELLKDDEAMRLLISKSKDQKAWKKQKEMLINFSIPKFDVSSQVDLREGLCKLGITDIFDQDVSDFSPMTADVDGMYLSRASHAARVSVDEEGVSAAAYTIMAVSGSGIPVGEEIDFVLDRPFLFTITGNDGLVLFAGVVEQPV